MEGAHKIGRRGDGLSTESSESASGLDAVLRPGDAFDGVVENGAVISCSIVDG